MELTVESSGKTKKFVEHLAHHMLRELNIEHLNKCVVIMVEPVDGGDLGLTLAMHSIDSFAVILNPNKSLFQLGVCLAHELIHVRQMIRGTLQDLPNGSHKWRGKVYKASTPYLKRPWEIDAYSKQELLFRKVIEL